MSGRTWRWCERRIARHVPPDRLPSVLGDLSEDYARRRATRGRIAATFWLLGESHSVSRAYARASRDDARTTMPWSVQLSHVWRSLARRPATPLACVAFLALAIGLLTTVFSVIDSLILRPAPFVASDRLIRQTFGRPERDLLSAWKTSGLFEAAEAVSETQVTLDDPPGPPLATALVTPGVFEMLGIAAHRGRTFSPLRGGSTDEVMLSAAVWRSMFGADESVIGRRVRAGGDSLVIVGIMPDSFRFPAPSTQLWRPLDLASAPRALTTLYGRLTSESPWAEVETRIAAMAAHHAYIPPQYRGTPPLQRVASSGVSRHTRQALSLLMGGAIAVFLVLTANAVVLLLSRVTQRQQEFAISTALGASRQHLLRQVTLEHVWIVAVAGIASLGVASALLALIPAHFLGRTLNVVDLDHRALIATVAAALLAAFIAVLPAWVGTREDTSLTLRRTDANGRTPLSRFATRAVLVTQIALAFGLLVGSTVLLRSFINMWTVDRGLDVDGVVRVRITNADEAFPTPAAKVIGIRTLRAHVSDWAEVRNAAISREIPPLPYVNRGDPDGEELDEYRVSSEFFSLYGIDVIEGQLFRDDFVTDEVIIGSRLAHALWPGQPAVGRVLRPRGAGARRVVGVVREITLPALDPALDRPELYLPLGDTSRTLYVNLRCVTTCPSIDVIRARLRTIHPALGASLLPPGDLAFLTQLELPEAIARAAAAFAVFALATAACGLFTVLTFAVRQRHREFGIRQMLGASPRQLRQLVFRDGMLVVAAGIAIGAGTGWLALRSLSAFLYGVGRFDVETWAAPLACLTMASLGAMWVPSKIAACTDPITVVREE